MKSFSPKSSNKFLKHFVKEAQYNEEDKTLIVESFKGDKIKLLDVPEDVYQKFSEVPAPDGFFFFNLKRRFKSEVVKD